LDLAALPDMKLLKLAALLHDLYGSFDFAHACLDAIDGRHGSKLAEDYLARLSAP
jgi:HD superfamily phosphodiesterase